VTFGVDEGVADGGGWNFGRDVPGGTPGREGGSLGGLGPLGVEVGPDCGGDFGCDWLDEEVWEGRLGG